MTRTATVDVIVVDSLSDYFSHMIVVLSVWILFSGREKGAEGQLWVLWPFFTSFPFSKRWSCYGWGFLLCRVVAISPLVDTVLHYHALILSWMFGFSGSYLCPPMWTWSYPRWHLPRCIITDNDARTSKNSLLILPFSNSL